MKVTIIGAGNVGSQIALLLALNKIDEIVLLDVAENVAIGKALDLQQSTACIDSDVKIIGTKDYDKTKDSDIIVITAGIVRKPGMGRDELLQTNAKIVREVTQKSVGFSPNSIIIVVSNPLDAMAYIAYKTSNFPKNRVVGMAGVLDTARMKSFIANEIGVNTKEVEAIVIGCHGDDMVPIIEHTKIKGLPASKVLGDGKLDQIIQKTKNGGAEIVNLLNTSAFFAPAFSVVEMIQSIKEDSKMVMPCSAFLDGEYDEKDIFIGVPVRLGKTGIEEVIELNLNKDENIGFKKACAHIRELMKKVDF